MNSGDWGKYVQFFRMFLFVLCEASGENAVAVSSLSPWLLMGSRVLVGLRSGKEGGEVKGDHWKRKREKIRINIWETEVSFMVSCTKNEKLGSRMSCV